MIAGLGLPWRPVGLLTRLREGLWPPCVDAPELSEDWYDAFKRRRRLRFALLLGSYFAAMVCWCSVSAVSYTC
jgi:hypothetical protein